ncbi:MAG TPA: Na+/H+ antiporter NhaA [Gammaproteobacteria bacterium]
MENEHTRLDRPVDEREDHVLGPSNAPITLVEYGSYDCPHCRAANERIAAVRTELGNRLRYVFRHRPITGSEIAQRAAELVEMARTPEQFWKAHVTLMMRSETLTEDDLRVVAEELGADDPAEQAERQAAAKARVARDIESARASGVRFTPTFFINGRRYDGAWDESSFSDAMLGTLGYKIRVAALSFASWAPAAGVLLLVATIVAFAISNSALAEAFETFWETPFRLAFGNAAFELTLREWIDDALLSVFFLVVGLEIKRELTVGHLAQRTSAALPIAAAIGGMALPALLYVLIVPTGGPWTRGWAVPMSTDTAFAIALIAMLGRRVPVELRIFLTAAAIVDDIGAILVVALFYSEGVAMSWLLTAAFFTVLLAMLNRSGVYRVSPYIVVGVALWAAVHTAGLHATLAGVLLAACIPARPPANYSTLARQADAILTDEARHGGEQLRFGPSESALRALDAIHDRLMSPTERVLRTVAPRSSFVVLPVFALANAGVELSGAVFDGHEHLMLAVAAGLVIGKPVGFLLLSALAVRLGLAVKPQSYSWRQLAGAGCLAGIGFTMALFIAGQAYELDTEFSAAKVAVFAASTVSALIGVVLLWKPADEEAVDQRIDATVSTPLQ